MNTINIYTDGSSFIKGNKYKSSSACIIDSDKYYYEFGMFHKNGTISYGELTAIRLGLDAIFNYTDLKYNKILKDYTINIFSDSQYCVKSLTEWIKGWSKYGKDAEWMKSDGKSVMYQDIMKYIYYQYLDNYNSIYMYHINSHLDSKTSYKKSCNKFLRKNKNFNEDDFKIITTYNNKVDELASSIMNNEINYYSYGVNKINGMISITDADIFKHHIHECRKG